MKALGDKPGHFTLSLTYVYNELQTWPAADNALIVIYRKQDNKLMDSLRINNQTIAKRPPVVFANAACATAAKMKISQVYYEGNIQLDPSTYTDPAGYYLAYQTCCRNGGITNIQQPSKAGYVYYLEFPPLVKDGKAITNSSPIFGTLNGEFICINKPFTFNFHVSDPDGDQLRYSIATPLYGYQDQNGNAYIRPAPYPEVNWVAGYGPANAIPGKPPLSVNPQTGELSVTATKLGLFVFAVQIEEFRNGEKIGEVRRDYQFLVIDCPTSLPPEVTISIQNQPAGTLEATVCEGGSIDLQATANASWHYQWKFNGSNIVGATTPTLTASAAGMYSLETSLKEQCSQSRSSESVSVKKTISVHKLRVDGALCTPGDKITLSAPPDAAFLYIWYVDKKVQPQFTTASLTTSLPGQYNVLMKSPDGCLSHTDTVMIAVRTPPTATITASTHVLCRGDSMLLRTSGGESYIWYLNGQIIPNALQATYSAQQAGEYTVRVKDSAGCSATSPAFSLTAVDKIRATLDSLITICGTTGSPIPLRGLPSGGLFTGPGVITSTTTTAFFDPAIAGVGKHVVTYTVQGASACQTGIASRYAVVAAIPAITLPGELSTWKGGSVELHPTLTIQPVRSVWQPSTYLTDPAQLITQASNLEEAITYNLQVESSEGCRAEATVRVTVYQRIWIPDAFTPNGDGLNEIWELKGIEAYPEAELTIFDRWGQIVFYTKEGYQQPFNGIVNGQHLPAGAYTYSLRPVPGKLQSINGVVLLTR